MDSELRSADRDGRHITDEMVEYLVAASGHRPSPDGSVMRTLCRLIEMYEASGDASV